MMFEKVILMDITIICKKENALNMILHAKLAQMMFPAPLDLIKEKIQSKESLLEIAQTI